ncbi:MAG: uracil-xanthine permease [Bacteroidales bacterium]|nr:uracil-xanthine permease [Bacteroidales bacterium]
MSNTKQEAIYDARVLGRGKMLTLGLQHMFAMFGATVLVPVITGLSMSATLLFAGLGTLIFHLLTKLKVPAFLGSSFAFLGGYASVVQMGMAEGLSQAQALPYACIGVFCAGLIYFILAGLFAWFGPKKVMRFFPPIVTGPIIIAIGLTLSGSAIQNCTQNWWIALLAILIIIVANIWGKGMIRILPILLGVIGSYVVAACFGLCDFTPVKEASWIGLPVKWENTAIAVFKNPNWGLIVAAIIAIIPISLATMMEHIGDMCAISSTTGVNYLENPGLHRTLMGDGLATALASVFGAPANTTYGENTGVLNLTKVFDPRVIRIAAIFAIVLSFCPKFSAIIACMPAATIGGVSLVLYGMISAVGVRNIVENQVDFTASRNVIIAALILVLAIGIKYGAGDAIDLGFTKLSGLAIAALVGVILNAFLPGKDYEFGENPVGDKSVNMSGTATRLERLRNPDWKADHDSYTKGKRIAPKDE